MDLPVFSFASFLAKIYQRVFGCVTMASPLELLWHYHTRTLQEGLNVIKRHKDSLNYSGYMHAIALYCLNAAFDILKHIRLS